jgi:O-antigen/teichoic acid export membrane protein
MDQLGPWPPSWQSLWQSAVFYGAFATAVRVGANILLLPFILKRFSTQELALWWVFVALGAVANVGDFGFGQAISRVYSFLWAGADDFDTEGLRASLPNSSPNYELIRRFDATVHYFYVRVSVVVGAILAVAGTPFVVPLLQPPVNRLWILLCWSAFILASAYSLAASRWVLACQGINRVREVQASYFWSGLSYVLVAAVMLIMGGGLETMVVATAVRAVVGQQLCARAYRRAIPNLRGSKPPADVSMLKRIWPNARRFFLLSLAAYVVANGATLMCSTLLGPDATASFGLTVQIGNFIANFSALWLSVKWPQITILRTQGELHRMAILFARRLLLVMVTFALSAVFLLAAGNYLLAMRGTHTRLLAHPYMLVYLVYLAQQQFYVQFGNLTFTENVVPFVGISIVTALALVGLSLVLTPILGLWGLILGPLIATVVCSSWYVVYRGFTGQPLSARQLVGAALYGRV